MRRLRLLLASILIATVQANAALAVVNAGCSNGTSASTSTSASSISVTGGNLLFVVASYLNTCSTATLSIADTAGNTFTAIGSAQSFSFNCSEVFYAKNVTGNASDVITVTASASVGFLDISAIQVSGADTATPLDAGPASNHVAASPATSASFSTGTANEILIAGVTNFYGNDTITAGTGYTIPSGAACTTGVSGDGQVAIEYQIVSSTQSSVTSSFTLTGANVYANVGVGTFKAGSSGTPHTVNTSDTVAVVDVPSALAAHFASPSEILRVTDIGSELASHFSTAAELLRIADGATDLANHLAAPFEAIEVRDSAARIAGFGRNGMETVPAIDSSRALAAHFAIAADMVPVADIGTRLAAFSRMTAETLPLFDGAIALKVKLLLVSESLMVTDMGTRIAAHLIATSEVESTSDVGSRIGGFLRSAPFEMAPLVDIGARNAGRTVAVTDSIQAADRASSQAAHFAIAIDLVATLDLSSLQKALLRSGIETAPAADSAAAHLGILRNAIEANGLREFASGPAAHFAIAAETLPVFDLGSRGGAGAHFVVAAAEFASVRDLGVGRASPPSRVVVYVKKTTDGIYIEKVTIVKVLP